MKDKLNHQLRYDFISQFPLKLIIYDSHYIYNHKVGEF